MTSPSGSTYSVLKWRPRSARVEYADLMTNHSFIHVFAGDHWNGLFLVPSELATQVQCFRCHEECLKQWVLSGNGHRSCEICKAEFRVVRERSPPWIVDFLHFIGPWSPVSAIFQLYIVLAAFALLIYACMTPILQRGIAALTMLAGLCWLFRFRSDRNTSVSSLHACVRAWVELGIGARQKRATILTVRVMRLSSKHRTHSTSPLEAHPFRHVTACA